MVKSELEILVNSINKLKASSEPSWGIMTSPQMLKHCNRQAKLYCNEYKSNFYTKILANTIGKMHLIYVKHIIKYDIHKYRKNSAGLKFLNTSKMNNLNFEEERKELIKRLQFVHDFNKKYITNPMHGRVRNETFKKNIFAHVKYHLNQFGVL
tara:strand:- start:616 stop:1074 length:459 start_codon:yes stop_codon:yes gene_type:complete